MQAGWDGSNSGRGVFQSSPGQKAGCKQGRLRVLTGGLGVSILTRPEGRVQGVASALTAARRGCEFQSSPGQKAGCKVFLPDAQTGECQFQSSPGQKAGCKWDGYSLILDSASVSILTPARRPGARR